MRILIVDDSAYLRSTLKTVLLYNGHEIVGEADNGESAIELAMELIPEVIILDNILPKMSGMEVLKTLKSRNHKAKIIMISAVGQESSLVDAKMYGAIEYLVKPFDHDNLIRILSELNP